MRAVIACILAGMVFAPAVAAIVSTTITIDGYFADWSGVRGDPANGAHDTQITDPDPDYPGQPDRDTYLVNATWDNDYLYIAMRRTSSGTKAIVWCAYIDRGGDGLLQSSDVVCIWKTNQNQGRYADAHAPDPTARILMYNQAIVGQGGPYLHPDGDPMGHDGETPDGWADIQSGEIVPQRPMDGWLTEDGIEFEGRVAWTDLGVEPGSPIAIHFANANGESLGQKWVPSDTHKWIGSPPQYMEENRGQIEDNVDDVWWLLQRGVSVAPDNFSGGNTGEEIPYVHTITNSSNTTDTFDLTASGAWTTRITDLNGDPLTAVTLARGASTQVKVWVTIPPDASQGAQNVTLVTARSQTDAGVLDTAADTTVAGRVTVTPDQAGSMAPSSTIAYTFTVGNNMPGGASAYDLSTLSSQGWPVRITDVDGNSILSVTLASGATTQVVAHVTVPQGTPNGVQDATVLTAVRSGDSSTRASATATTRVMDGLDITPDNAGYAGAGGFALYSHTVTNSWPTTRTVALSYLSSRGWPVTFFAEDGVTEITSVTVGPNGATVPILVRVSVPAGTVSNTSDITTVTATAPGSPDAAATDATTIRRLMTFADTAYVTPEFIFDLTSTTYARASGLSPGDTVFFRWYDQNGVLVRTCPDRTVDTQGMQFDSYTSALTDPIGSGWRVELWKRQGKNNITLLESTSFTEKFKAAITQVSATDAPSVGTTVSVSSSAENYIGRDITGTVMTYLVWWDENGDGAFGAGDTWIDSAGAPHSYGGTETVSTHITTGVDVAGQGTWSESPPWTLSNSQFPHRGYYNVTATWTTSGGLMIDQKTSQFFAVPALGWPLFALFVALATGLGWRRLLADRAVIRPC